MHHAIDSLGRCTNEISYWITSNWLWLNTDKTQRTLFEIRQQLAKLSISHIRVGNSDIVIRTDLGEQLDCGLKMSSHVQFVTKTGFYHLRQLRSVWRSLPTEVSQSLAQALILAHIDYCNSVLNGASVAVINCLQTVLHANARLISNRRKFYHVTEFICDDLHWLPMNERIEFKLFSQTYKCLHGLASSYLATYCQPVSSNAGRRHLRSSVTGQLLIPMTKARYGARGFAVADPLLWNNLPVQTRDLSLSLADFKVKLKTHIFCRSYLSDRQLYWGF